MLEKCNGTSTPNKSEHGIDGTTPWKRWRNITTDVGDGYVNQPSIHETNKRFSVVVCQKRVLRVLWALPRHWRGLSVPQPCFEVIPDLRPSLSQNMVFRMDSTRKPAFYACFFNHPPCSDVVIPQIICDSDVKIYLSPLKR